MGLHGYEPRCNRDCEPRRAEIAPARFGGGESIQREWDRMNRKNMMDKIYNPGAPGRLIM